MPEAWEITTSDERTENQVVIFIIFCEDENDEPYYFRSFGVENKVRIHCISNQKRARLNLINTLSYCQNLGLVECINHSLKIKDGVTENIWCVYDRDLESPDFDKIIEKDDLNFTTAIDTAEKAGLKVAWSNDAFELWVLLHFEVVPANYKLHRNYIYERLTEILKHYPEINKKYKRLIDDSMFSYKIHLKQRLAFLLFVLPILKEKLDFALENAEKIERKFQGNIPYHDCNPSTKVHHLVNCIIEAQT